MGRVTLTDEQFDFLNVYHEALIYGEILVKFFGDKRVIDSIIALKGYKELMGDMGWDDVLDRYEDHPNYDNSLYLMLHEQFNMLNIY
jgi:hypothetical protein